MLSSLLTWMAGLQQVPPLLTSAARVPSAEDLHPARPSPTPSRGFQPVPLVLFKSLQYPTLPKPAVLAGTTAAPPLRSLTSAAWELYFSLMSVYLSMPYCFKKLFTTSLPPRCIFFSWSGLHASIDTDLQSGALREHSMHAGQYERKMGMTQ